MLAKESFKIFTMLATIWVDTASFPRGAVVTGRFCLPLLSLGGFSRRTLLVVPVVGFPLSLFFEGFIV